MNGKEISLEISDELNHFIEIEEFGLELSEVQGSSFSFFSCYFKHGSECVARDSLALNIKLVKTG